MRFTLWQLMLVVTFIGVFLALVRVAPVITVSVAGLIGASCWRYRQLHPRETPKPPGTWSYREVVDDD